MVGLLNSCVRHYYSVNINWMLLFRSHITVVYVCIDIVILTPLAGQEIWPGSDYKKTDKLFAEF